MSKSMFKSITQAILAQLEKGEIPWRQPWTANGPPRSLMSKRPYRGINVFLLSSKGYVSPFWITEGALHRIGGTLKDGEAPTEIVLWRWRIRQAPVASSDDDSSYWVPFLWQHSVYNTDQCDGINIANINRRHFDPIKTCERIVENMPNKPAIEHGVPRAFYRPAFDQVNMPNPELFVSSSAYYAVLFHELVHATGHPSRLDRHKPLKEGFRHDEHAYSKEELIAEFGAALLCAHARVSPITIENSGAYIENWLNKLGGDKRFLFYAVLHAQKAVDFIRGEQRKS